MTPSITRLPVITIGGFLGAGKTTLVNYLLANSSGQRIAVFVNDFGTINIDLDRIDSRSVDRISFKNGCVCCSLNDDLVARIAGFAKSSEPPDTIVIEASGVADPRAIDKSVSMLEVAGLARLDARIHVLDADGFEQYEFDESELIIDQAAAADFIVLNKVDLVDEQILSRIRMTLEESAPQSRVVETTQCEIPAELTSLNALVLSPRRDEAPHKAIHTDKSHGTRYTHWAFQSTESLDKAEFEKFVAMLSKHCLRAKGIIRFTDNPASEYLFDLVGNRASVEPRVLDRAGAKKGLTVLVAIGRTKELSKTELTQAISHTVTGDIQTSINDIGGN